jgi:hypothetical protein
MQAGVFIVCDFSLQLFGRSKSTVTFILHMLWMDFFILVNIFGLSDVICIQINCVLMGREVVFVLFCRGGPDGLLFVEMSQYTSLCLRLK